MSEIDTHYSIVSERVSHHFTREMGLKESEPTLQVLFAFRKTSIHGPLRGRLPGDLILWCFIKIKIVCKSKKFELFRSYPFNIVPLKKKVLFPIHAVCSLSYVG